MYWCNRYSSAFTQYPLLINIFLSLVEMATASSSSSNPMCRSFSSESQRKEWSKRLSLRGIHKNRDVNHFVEHKKKFICFTNISRCYRILLPEKREWHDAQHHYGKHVRLKYQSMFPFHRHISHLHQCTRRRKSPIGKWLNILVRLAVGVQLAVVLSQYDEYRWRINGNSFVLIHI